MSMGLNQQSWDLGLGSRELQNSTIVDEHIKILEDQFHLVRVYQRSEGATRLAAHSKMKGSECKIVNSQMFQKAANLRAYLSGHDL